MQPLDQLIDAYNFLRKKYRIRQKRNGVTSKEGRTADQWNFLSPIVCYVSEFHVCFWKWK
jgi:hypothetical protein